MPHNKINLASYLVRPTDSVRSVMAIIDRNKDGVALVVDEAGKLIGTITDGNVRRYILDNGELAATCRHLIEKEPYTASIDAPLTHIMSLVQSHRLLHVPLVDTAGRPQKLWRLRDLLSDTVPAAMAVVMVGGEGKRLRPLTETLPKPMVEVGGRPALEHIIEQVVASGITDIFLAVNYRAEIIEKHFGGGERFKAHIRYLKENTKLGTAGALTLLPDRPTAPVLVMNGDVVAHAPLPRLFDWHYQHQAALTVGAVEWRTQVPFGVLECDGYEVRGVTEKPERTFLCSAGMYMLEPHLLDLLEAGEAADMTDILSRAIAGGYAVSAFPLHEEWVDIGRHEDLQRASRLVSSAV